MEIINKEETQKALAIIAKCYLKNTNSKTYDLRCFEYWSGHSCYTKIPNLIRAVDFFKLTVIEQQAVKHLKNLNIMSVKNELEYTKELIRN